MEKILLGPAFVGDLLGVLELHSAAHADVLVWRYLALGEALVRVRQRTVGLASVSWWADEGHAVADEWTQALPAVGDLQDAPRPGEVAVLLDLVYRREAARPLEEVAAAAPDRRAEQC